MNPDFKNYLLQRTEASECMEVEVIQSLWSGYGKIIRYQLVGAAFPSVVVKHIVSEVSNAHPRGWNTNYSHERKLKSYRVETHWYEKWSQTCDGYCKVPTFIGSFSQRNEQWIVLEDLNRDFPLRKDQLDKREIKDCLNWLANFHATFMNQKPHGLWEVGTYWHLATRPDEFKRIEHTELKEKAHLIDKLLNNCKYQTIVHGDAKLANFCFARNNENVHALAAAAVDFQYVGGGCGMKDVSYFLGSCLTEKEFEVHEDELLDFYFSSLQIAIEAMDQNVSFEELEREWRTMYPMATADFTRFLLGWMPSHQKGTAYNLTIMQTVLARL